MAAWLFSSGGASSKMAPFQFKHCYKVSEEIGSLLNFPIFLLVFFDTLNWARAGCIRKFVRFCFFVGQNTAKHKFKDQNHFDNNVQVQVF